MSYIEAHLMEGERIVYRAKLHPVVLTGSVVAIVIGGLLAVHGNELLETHVFGKIPREIMRQIPPGKIDWLREGWHGYNWIGLFILVFKGLFGFISALLNIVSSEFGVSNRRVLMKTGLISRRSLETLLNKVESISVFQGVFGRLFGYGTILIGGTGGSKEVFFGIRNPMEFRRQVQEQIVHVEG